MSEEIRLYRGIKVNSAFIFLKSDITKNKYIK